jgi:DNA transformation protein
MSSSQSIIDLLPDQLANCGAVTARKMFGEYCLYYAGRPVGLVCDKQLLLKNTVQGHGLIEKVLEAAPCPRAKPHLLLTANQWDDRHNLCQLVRVTADALSLARPFQLATTLKRHTNNHLIQPWNYLYF